MHVHVPEFGAAMQPREHLAGIEQALGIEGALEPLLLVEIGLRELHRHQIALLDADAVLAGQYAADLDAAPENIGAEFFGPLELIGIIGVVTDQRMQIAIAGMEYIGHAQLVAPRIPPCAHHLRQLPARDGTVHAEIIGRHATNGWGCRLPAGPE